jgi:hypothetical protein
VTLQRTIRRDPISIATKTYRHWKVNETGTKTSQATITLACFRTNEVHLDKTGKIF